MKAPERIIKAPSHLADSFLLPFDKKEEERNEHLDKSPGAHISSDFPQQQSLLESSGGNTKDDYII